MKRKTLILVVLSIMCGTVLGATGAVKITAELMQTKIVKDNKQVLNDTKVISYKGTTYVPLRAFAEVTGVEVNYSNGTIYLGDNSQLLSNTSKDLNEDVQNRDKEVKEVLFKESDKTYLANMKMYVNNNKVYLPINTVITLLGLDGEYIREYKEFSQLYINNPKTNAYTLREEIKPGGISGSLTIYNCTPINIEKQYTDFNDRDTTIYYNITVTHLKNNKSIKYITEKVNQFRAEGIDFVGISYAEDICELKALDEIINFFNLSIKYEYDQKTNTVTIMKK